MSKDTLKATGWNTPVISRQDYAILKRDVRDITCFDIEAFGLTYVDMHSHEGMQCNRFGGTPEYERIYEICREINKLIKELDKLNHPNK